MNYLNFKNNYPKSTAVFFCWVADQDAIERTEYVDNDYFYQFISWVATQNTDKPKKIGNNAYSLGFFSNLFDYYQGFGVTIKEKKIIDVLKPILLNNKKQFKDIWGNNIKILVEKDCNTGDQYIDVKLGCESDYEIVFYILEILINKGLYA